MASSIVRAQGSAVAAAAVGERASDFVQPLLSTIVFADVCWRIDGERSAFSSGGASSAQCLPSAHRVFVRGGHQACAARAAL